MAVEDGPGPSDGGHDYLANYAATTIQKHFRGHRVRKEYLAKRARIRQLEQQWASADAYANRVDWAARRIQSSWRAYRNVRIYRYYRDLIQFRERGEPRELLRVINPREAQLADAAAGVHVRFRLGGTTFPPLVFYKIFTHRAVVDIGAFGPRDYANEVRMTAAELNNRAPASTSGPAAATGSGSAGGATAAPGPAAAKRRHEYKESEFELDESFREYIKPDGSIGYRSTQGWYERFENNGWRPVAERVLLDEDPVTTMTRLRKQPLFHHSPLQRKEDRARRAKQRKREWLKKVYLAGGTGLLGATAGQVAAGGGGPMGPDGLPLPSLEDLDIDGLGDDELDAKADELLAWSQHLDFGAYVDDWTGLATTLGSEAMVPEDEAPYLAALPGAARDVRPMMAAAGAPMVPFKGGPSGACGTTSHVALQ